MKFVDDYLAIEVVEVDQEFIGMFRLDFEWMERFFGEMFQGPSDYLVGERFRPPQWK